MSAASRPLNNWDLLIEYEVERGLAADEIADAFDHMFTGTGEVSTRAGEWLDWSTLYGRRRILKLIAAITGTPLAEQSTVRPTGSVWQSFVGKFREARVGVSSPTKLATANRMGWTDEESLTKFLRDNFGLRWRDAKRFVETEPE
jgi:hypothetical protein